MKDLIKKEFSVNDDLRELFQKQTLEYPSFIQQFESKANSGIKEGTRFINQEEAFRIVEEQVTILKKTKQLREFCKVNNINYFSLNVLRYKINHKDDTTKAPKLILQLLQIFFKNVEMRKEVYYLVSEEKKD